MKVYEWFRVSVEMRIGLVFTDDIRLLEAGSRVVCFNKRGMFVIKPCARLGVPV